MGLSTSLVNRVPAFQAISTLVCTHKLFIRIHNNTASGESCVGSPSSLSPTTPWGPLSIQQYYGSSVFFLPLNGGLLLLSSSTLNIFTFMCVEECARETNRVMDIDAIPPFVLPDYLPTPERKKGISSPKAPFKLPPSKNIKLQPSSQNKIKIHTNTHTHTHTHPLCISLKKVWVHSQ